jgi:dihydrofolate synthase/folylpolyglutamate synthase
VVSGAVGDALVVIGQVASQRGAPVTWIDQNMWTRTSYEEEYQEFLVQGLLKDYTVQTSMLGPYQGENISLAVAAVEQLQIGGVYLTDRDIQDGIKAATHPGRMEIISAEPLILLDGAHNPAGMSVLVKTLEEDFSTHRLVVVLGVLKDKDLKTMVSTIMPISDVFIVTKSGNPRAADPLVLKEMIAAIDVDKTVFVEDSIPRAIDHAKRVARQNDMICVTGSLFTVGEARGYVLHVKTNLSGF